MTPDPQGTPRSTVHWRDQDAIVEVTGEIDLARSTMFQRELLTLLDDKPQRIIIDLSGVPHMDSSGIASLVKLLSRTRKFSISLKLAAMTPRVTSVFEITHLDRVFDIYPSVEEAMA